MKYRLCNYALAALACVCAVACGNSHKRTAEDAARKSKTVKDSTLYARIDSNKGDTIYVTALGDGRKYAFEYVTAMHKGHMVGAPEKGDTIAAMPDFKGRNVESAINTTLLHGLWMSEDNAGTGIRLTADGGAFSIGSEKETLRSWRISNGQIILTYVGSPESATVEKSEAANIAQLDATTLSLNFDGKLRVYKRQTQLISK